MHTIEGSQPTLQHLSVLKTRFRIGKFKSSQWRVIKNILHKPSSDQFFVAASGYGKSLCYQFVPVYTKSLALVISPLISLMQDQVRVLNSLGIPAINFGYMEQDYTEEWKRVLKMEFLLVYMTPEYCMDQGIKLIKSLYDNVSISLVALDEVHCVSSWGNDFRPEYGRLALLRELLPNVPFLALTATANKNVTHDILTNLSLQNTIFIKLKLNRPNVYFEIHEKEPSIEANLKMFLHKKRPPENGFTFNGPCIIYCLYKVTTEKVCAVLKRLGVTCEYYHADLTPANRETISNDFFYNRLDCIVASVAYGMSNKLDIRTMIHYEAPKNMDDFMQNVGGVGRDGKRCKSIILSSMADITMIQRIVQADLINKQNLRQLKIMMKLMKEFEKFVYSKKCRRQEILNHYNELYNPNHDGPSPKCCDICSTKYNQTDEPSNLFKTILLVRDVIADVCQSNPDEICSIEVLRALVQIQPRDMCELKSIYCISDNFCVLYGRIFLKNIQKFNS